MAPLITPFRVDLSPNNRLFIRDKFQHSEEQRPRRSFGRAANTIHAVGNDLCRGMVEITVINELAFPTSRVPAYPPP